MTEKEKIYDARISPLMVQILEICAEHKIAFLASFALGPDPEADDTELMCTSGSVEEDRNPPVSIVEATRIIISGRPFSMISILVPPEPPEPSAGAEP